MKNKNEPLSFANVAKHAPLPSAEIIQTNAVSIQYDTGKIITEKEEREKVKDTFVVEQMPISFASAAAHAPLPSADIVNVPTRTETLLVTPQHSFALAAHAGENDPNHPSQEVYVPTISQSFDESGSIESITASNIKLHKNYEAEECVAIVEEVSAIQKLNKDTRNKVADVTQEGIKLGNTKVQVGPLVHTEVELPAPKKEQETVVQESVVLLATIEKPKTHAVSGYTAPSAHESKDEDAKVKSPAEELKSLQSTISKDHAKKVKETAKEESKNVQHNMVESIHDATVKLVDAKEGAVMKAMDAKEQVEKELGKAKDVASKKLGDAKNVATEKVLKAKEAATEKFLDAKDTASDKFSTIKDAATSKISDAKETAKEGLSSAQAIASDSYKTAKKVAIDLEDAAETAFTEAKEVASEWREPIKEFGQAVIETAQQGADDLSDATTHLAKDTIDSGKRTAQQFVSTQKETANQILEQGKANYNQLKSVATQIVSSGKDTATSLVEQSKETASQLYQTSQQIMNTGAEFSQAVVATGENVMEDLKSVGWQVKDKVARRGSEEMNKGYEALQHVEERAKQIQSDLYEEAENAKQLTFAATQSVAQAAIGTAVYVEEAAEGLAYGTVNLARDAVYSALGTAVGVSQYALGTASDATSQAVKTGQDTYNSLRSGVRSASNSALHMAEQVKDTFDEYTHTELSIEEVDEDDKLSGLVDVMKKMKTCMITTKHDNDALYSRAGYIVPSDLDNLYIFSLKGPHPASTALHTVDRQVNLALQNAASGEWVSISGDGFKVDSDAVYQKHWSEDVKNFFGPTVITSDPSEASPQNPRLELTLVKIKQVSYSTKVPVVKTPVGIMSSLYNGVTSLVSSKQTAMSVRELNEAELMHARMGGIEE